MNRLRILAWKEVLEVIRDRRTIALMALSALLLPLLGILVSGLRAQQQAIIVVMVCDKGVEARRVAEMLVEAYNSTPGFIVVEAGCRYSGSYVFAIEIPRGFTVNATSIDKPVYVKYYRVVGSVAAQQAEAIADNILYKYSDKLASRRVKVLASRAGMPEVNPETILHPVRVVTETLTPTGRPATPSIEARASIARFLSFAVFLVLNPAAVAVVDALVGERERGTAEMLVASPLTPRELVLGKTIGGLVLALIAAAIDAAGVVAYLALTGTSILAGLGPDLAAVHAVETLLAVIVTAAITIPIAVRAPTPRSATLGALMVTGIATAIFFASFFVDLDKLPPTILAALYIIPYTHISLAIYSYALGEKIKTLIHTSVVIAMTVAATAAAAKAYNPETYLRQV